MQALAAPALLLFAVAAHGGERLRAEVTTTQTEWAFFRGETKLLGVPR